MTELQLLPKIADPTWLKKYIHNSGFYPGSGSDFMIMFDVPRRLLPSAKWVFVDYGGLIDSADGLINMPCGREKDFHDFQGTLGYERVGEVIDITELFRSCYELDDLQVSERFPQKILYSFYYNKKKKHTIEAIFLMGFEAVDTYKVLYNEQKPCALFLLKDGLGTKYSQGTDWCTPLVQALWCNSPKKIVANNGPYGQKEYQECINNVRYYEQNHKPIRLSSADQEEECLLYELIRRVPVI